jgi:hypothetical protein
VQRARGELSLKQLPRLSVRMVQQVASNSSISLKTL